MEKTQENGRFRDGSGRFPDGSGRQDVAKRGKTDGSGTVPGRFRTVPHGKTHSFDSLGGLV